MTQGYLQLLATCCCFKNIDKTSFVFSYVDSFIIKPANFLCDSSTRNKGLLKAYFL